MSKKIDNLKIGIDEELEERLQWLVPDYSSFHILRKSVDARRRHDVHFLYSLEVFEKGEVAPQNQYPIEPVKYNGEPVIIVGSGPAGLFAAVRLAERGIPCLVIERGSNCKDRLKKIVRFWRHGELDKDDNVCFGEGGAGLYSDGKLITRIKSPHIPYVLQRLVQFGAPEEIQYLANPHVGSDKIRRIIPFIRQHIEKLGGKFLFNSCVEKLLIEGHSISGVELRDGTQLKSPHVILACGHSAEELFNTLHQQGIYMEGKSFAVGVRVEHPQSLINEIQYRQYADHPKLGSANYKLAFHNKDTDRGVYSFCMCPGGYVLSSGTEENHIVVNGMSNYNRNSAFANSAIVTTINHEKQFGEDLFGGMKFRKNLESMAYQQVVQAGGSKEIPGQNLLNFLEQKPGEVLKSSSPSGTLATRVDQLFDTETREHLYLGIEKFDKSMKGFINQKAQVFGVESRTSCPLRITRNKDSLQSVSHEGLYPTGEGAGYAGGITSAACDGVLVAEKIVQRVSSQAFAE